MVPFYRYQRSTSGTDTILLVEEVIVIDEVKHGCDPHVVCTMYVCDV